MFARRLLCAAITLISLLSHIHSLPRHIPRVTGKDHGHRKVYRGRNAKTIGGTVAQNPANSSPEGMSLVVGTAAKLPSASSNKTKYTINERLVQYPPKRRRLPDFDNSDPPDTRRRGVASRYALLRRMGEDVGETPEADDNFPSMNLINKLFNSASMGNIGNLLRSSAIINQPAKASYNKPRRKRPFTKFRRPDGSMLTETELEEGIIFPNGGVNPNALNLNNLKISTVGTKQLMHKARDSRLGLSNLRISGIPTLNANQMLNVGVSRLINKLRNAGISAELSWLQNHNIPRIGSNAKSQFTRSPKYLHINVPVVHSDKVSPIDVNPKTINVQAQYSANRDRHVNIVQSPISFLPSHVQWSNDSTVNRRHPNIYDQSRPNIRSLPYIGAQTEYRRHQRFFNHNVGKHLATNVPTNAHHALLHVNNSPSNNAHYINSNLGHVNWIPPKMDYHQTKGTYLMSGYHEPKTDVGSKIANATPPRQRVTNSYDYSRVDAINGLSEAARVERIISKLLAGNDPSLVSNIWSLLSRKQNDPVDAIYTTPVTQVVDNRASLPVLVKPPPGLPEYNDNKLHHSYSTTPIVPLAPLPISTEHHKKNSFVSIRGSKYKNKASVPGVYGSIVYTSPSPFVNPRQVTRNSIPGVVLPWQFSKRIYAAPKVIEKYKPIDTNQRKSFDRMTNTSKNIFTQKRYNDTRFSARTISTRPHTLKRLASVGVNVRLNNAHIFKKVGSHLSKNKSLYSRKLENINLTLGTSTPIVNTDVVLKNANIPRSRPIGQSRKVFALNHKLTKNNRFINFDKKRGFDLKPSQKTRKLKTARLVIKLKRKGHNTRYIKMTPTRVLGRPLGMTLTDHNTIHENTADNINKGNLHKKRSKTSDFRELDTRLIGRDKIRLLPNFRTRRSVNTSWQPNTVNLAQNGFTYNVPKRNGHVFNRNVNSFTPRRGYGSVIRIGNSINYGRHNAQNINGNSAMNAYRQPYHTNQPNSLFNQSPQSRLRQKNPWNRIGRQQQPYLRRAYPASVFITTSIAPNTTTAVDGEVEVPEVEGGIDTTTSAATSTTAARGMAYVTGAAVMREHVPRYVSNYNVYPYRSLPVLHTTPSQFIGQLYRNNGYYQGNQQFWTGSLSTPAPRAPFELLRLSRVKMTTNMPVNHNFIKNIVPRQSMHIENNKGHNILSAAYNQNQPVQFITIPKQSFQIPYNNVEFSPHIVGANNNKFSNTYNMHPVGNFMGAQSRDLTQQVINHSGHGSPILASGLNDQTFPSGDHILKPGVPISNLRIAIPIGNINHVNSINPSNNIPGWLTQSSANNRAPGISDPRPTNTAGVPVQDSVFSQNQAVLLRSHAGQMSNEGILAIPYNVINAVNDHISIGGINEVRKFGAHGRQNNGYLQVPNNMPSMPQTQTLMSGNAHHRIMHNPLNHMSAQNLQHNNFNTQNSQYPSQYVPTDHVQQSHTRQSYLGQPYGPEPQGQYFLEQNYNSNNTLSQSNQGYINNAHRNVQQPQSPVAPHFPSTNVNAPNQYQRALTPPDSQVPPPIHTNRPAYPHTPYSPPYPYYPPPPPQNYDA